MPFPLIPALLAAGTAVMGHIGKKEAAKTASKEHRKVEGIKAKYSPWTGITPGATPAAAHKPALMPDIMAGLGTAMKMGDQAKKAEADQAYRDRYLDILQQQAQASSGGGASPWAGMAQTAAPRAAGGGGPSLAVPSVYPTSGKLPDWMTGLG